MSKVAIVIDSTANLPKPLLDQYPIRVLPLSVVWDNNSYRDGIEITPDQFYQRLSTGKTIPTTAQATPEQFREVYSELIAQGFDVLAVVISSQLSGTYQAALQAQSRAERGRVIVVDSTATSMAMGFPVLQAARAAEKGADLGECEEIALRLRGQSGVMFVVDTLKYLHLGGRIGGGARFLGTALNLKPILELTGGKIEAIERVRNKRKAVDRILDLIEQRIAGRTPVRIATLHAMAYNEAAELLERANERLHPVESYISEVSPVVGVHTGPGVVGLAYMVGD